MGQEARCRARHRDHSCEGKALLETDELIFRGKPVRFAIPYSQIREVSAENGVLHVRWENEEAELELGDLAGKWLKKITNPRTLVDKLGVKTGMRVSIVGIDDPSLIAMLESRDAEIHAGAGTKASDIVFFGVENRDQLPKLREMKKLLKPNGAIWIIRPKGSEKIRESDVMGSAREAGLVDVKVARYSDEMTAEKLVIPVKDR
jgi:hypothetical protein